MRFRLTGIVSLTLFLVSCHSQIGSYRCSSVDSLAFKGNDTLSVMFIGDVMMHKQQFKDDYHSFFKHIADTLRSADITVANMEFSLGGEPYTGYPRFSAPDYMASYMAGECGVDVFLTANNHILDRGSDGLKRTLGIYSSMKDSVQFTGSAFNEEDMANRNPLIIKKKDISIAIVNFTYGTNGLSVKGWPNTSYLTEENIKETFARARKDSVDFIIAAPHWGNEYVHKHNNCQRLWAEMMVKEGADVIVGTHPHVVQDSSHIGNVPVIYSLGNAISHMISKDTSLEMAAKLLFVRERESGRTYMLEPQFKYMWNSVNGALEKDHATIFVDDWIGKRDEWLNPNDYDRMLSTLARVKNSVKY